jgi:hypothetical protein
VELVRLATEVVQQNGTTQWLVAGALTGLTFAAMWGLRRCVRARYARFAETAQVIRSSTVGAVRAAISAVSS